MRTEILVSPHKKYIHQIPQYKNTKNHIATLQEEYKSNVTQKNVTLSKYSIYE
jgi:hypothetical protein